ncbi:MAG: SpoIIIAH-like family protein [Clostridia bacterium]|nr:SpoIIIAH-like family protein [Clostridia bacterium]
MNIGKAKNLLSETGKKIKRGFSRENMKRNIIVLASLGIIGGAVYLNWSYFKPGDSLSEASKSGNGSELVDIENSESYFAMTEVSRQRTRDEALEVLQTIVDNEATAEEDRNAALNAINVIAANIQSEGNIESLVVSKGFEDCVAVISEGNATVVVKSDGLLENEITQIQEIVYTEAGILPENLKIVEKSA